MEMEEIVNEANAFIRSTGVITLDSLLALEKAISKEFEQFNARVEATKGFWIRMNGWDGLSKPELLDLAREREAAVRTSDSKAELLAAVVASFWAELDAAAAFARARDENDRIRRWARRLREVPDRLQELIDDANKLFEEQWKKKQTTIHEAANALRWNGLTLMEWEWAAARSHRALDDLNKGKELADVVHWLAHEVQMAIMGVVATNISASGTGLEHMAPIGGAKLLTKAFYRAVPEGAKPFLSTVYN